MPPASNLNFNGMPFENGDDFGVAIGILNDGIENYPYERFGCKKTEKAPYLGMGAEAEGAVPVEKP